MKPEESKTYFKEFDKHGRYIESPCYGCDMDDCRFCPRDKEDRI